MSIRRHAMGISLSILCGAGALAADIYRCQVNGVTAFVDSPGRCTEGGAQREGRDEPKAKAVAPQSAPTARGTHIAKESLPVSAVRPAASSVVSSCQKLAQDPTRFRQCIRDERRAEVRQIATLRLAEISRAVADYVNAAVRSGSVIAVSNKGRSPAWCEDILQDIMAQKNFDVVDDETAGGPRWIQSGNEPGRSAAEILDPNFREWNFAGRKVPDGYVTARWRTTNLVVLRVTAACTAADDGTAHCNPQRHTSVYVYDDATPVACHVSAVGRPYWPTWKDSMTSIFAKGSMRSSR